MSEMTLPSRHRIRNSNPRGLRPSTLPLGHSGSPKHCFLRVDEVDTFLFLFHTAEAGKRIPNSSLKGSVDNHYTRGPALYRPTWIGTAPGVYSILIRDAYSTSGQHFGRGCVITFENFYSLCGCNCRCNLHFKNGYTLNGIIRYRVG